MIDDKILFLTVTDCSDRPIVKKYKLDAHVHHNFEVSTINPLRSIFSKVIVYDYLVNYVDYGVKKTNQDIIDLVAKEHPKYILWATYMYEILESTFDTVRKMGAIVIGWFFDDEVRFDDYSKWWIPHLDIILTTDKESVDKYRELGARAFFFPMFSNPEYFRRLLELPQPRHAYSLKEAFEMIEGDRKASGV